MAGLVGAPLKGGFNQNGGGYYITTVTISPNNILTYSGGSGSGGSFATGTFAAISSLTVGTAPGQAPANYSVPFTAGNLIRDMGKTIVSSGRTFRKFQGILPTSGNSSPSFGVSGTGGTSTLPGYLTAYLEVGREGAGTPAAIARYA